MIDDIRSLPNIPKEAAGSVAYRSHSIFVILSDTPNGGQRRQLRGSKQGALAAAEKAKARGLEAEVLLAQLSYWGRVDV